jgi:putative oxidoreductase
MFGAIAMVHSRYGLLMNWYGNQEGHGVEYHLVAIALALIVIVKGAGAFSVDYVLLSASQSAGSSSATDYKEMI